ncbi:hypothetical protein OTB20_23830 [Streptomyces sp. H27-H1]|uniref:hypothetical protein n=1 Tax=Streptomyces sp. H27-H1 TaxID=2996461 RepID=UPI00226E9962|nr:hypothetical protein [Streptomyces sp. H27-H1]MCY0929171.1 hypothetical protein [Streptomyces sp. H27-H1]
MTDAVFAKNFPDSTAARREVDGHRLVEHRLSVPRLHGLHDGPDGSQVVFDDVFAQGRCELLLGDIIALADRDPSQIPRVVELVEAVCHDLTTAFMPERRYPLSSCVPTLYADRIRPGGRLDTWYLNPGHSLVPAGGNVPALTAADLADHTITVNGRPLAINLPDIVHTTRQILTPDSSWVSGHTQGDPTEPNIADPLCWLDFTLAGLNTLPGEAANLLWYLMGLGGWLVPTYQPETYQRTMRLALPPLTTPRITHLYHHPRLGHFDIHYEWNTGPGRRAALTTALQALPDIPWHDLRPFLTLRVLGVVRPWPITTTDTLLLLVKAAELHQTSSNATEFFTQHTCETELP